MVRTPGVSPEPLIADSFSINWWHNNASFDELPVRLRYHTIHLVQNGTGGIYIDDKAYRLEQNQIIIIAKGQVQAFAPGSLIHGYSVSFGDCFWEKTPAGASNCKAVLFNNAEANQQLTINPGDLNEVSPLFKLLFVESGKRDYSNKLVLLPLLLSKKVYGDPNISPGSRRRYSGQRDGKTSHRTVA